MLQLVGNLWRRNRACDLTQQNDYADSKVVAVQQTEGIPWVTQEFRTTFTDSGGVQRSRERSHSG
jgi:hypothetical protein